MPFPLDQGERGNGVRDRMLLRTETPNPQERGKEAEEGGKVQGLRRRAGGKREETVKLQQAELTLGRGNAPTLNGLTQSTTAP